MYDPLHRIEKDETVDSMVETLRRGGQLPSIVVIGEQALTGAHRIMAVEIAREKWEGYADGWGDAPEPKLEAIEITDEEYAEAHDMAGGDESYIPNYLYRNTNRNELKEALEDQLI